MDGMYLVLVFIVTIIRQSGNVGFVTVLTIVKLYLVHFCALLYHHYYIAPLAK